ncbi:MAG: hypothetical protein KDI36_11700, partial [Pseudomonadales bacterium]|nr:hypothetical protein [Pseudomonadales bacterium]
MEKIRTTETGASGILAYTERMIFFLVPDCLWRFRYRDTLPLKLLRLIFIAVLSVSAGVVQAVTVNAIQSGTVQSTGNGVVTVNVSAVDMAKSLLVFQTRHRSDRPTGSTIRGELASSTALTFSRATNESSVIDIQWYLVEFASGVSVQRGTAVQSSATTRVSLPVSLGSHKRAFVLISKSVASTDVSFDDNDPVVAELVSASRLEIRAAAANSAHVVAWQVAEVTDRSADVSRGSTRLTDNGERSVTDEFRPEVDRAKSLLLSSWNSADSGNDIDERLITAFFDDASHVMFRRGDNGGDDVDEIVYEVVSFSDGTSVQSGNLQFNPGETSKTATISAIDPRYSLPLSTVQAYGGQAMGNTTYSSDDVVGESAFTMSLTPSSVTVTRSSSMGTSRVDYQVVSFPAAAGGGGGGGGSSACASIAADYPLYSQSSIIVGTNGRIN